MMRAFKQLTTALIVCLCIGGCAAGNKVKLDPKNPVTVRVWHYYHGPQQQAFDNIVSEFNSNIGIQEGVIVEAHGYGNVIDLAEAVLASANGDIGAKEMPDIFSTYSDDAIILQEMGKLAELDDYLTAEELAAYVPSFLDEGRMGAENSHYILPVAKSSEIGMLNKTDFDIFASEMKKQGKNISYEDLHTFESIVKVSEEYFKWTDAQTPDVEYDGKAFFGLDVVANYMNATAKQLGREIVTITDGTAAIGYDKATIKKLWDIYYINMLKGYFIANGSFRSDDAKFGDLLYLVGATTGVAYFPTKVTDIDGNSHDVEMMAIAMPVMAGGDAVAVQQGAGMCVAKSDELREYASCMFLKWFTGEQYNINFAIDSYGYMPVINNAALSSSIENQMERLRNDESDPSKSQVQKNAALVMECFFDQFNNYSLYMQKPFTKSAALRTELGSLGIYTKEAVTAARAEIEAGADYTQVVEKYCADEVFEAWYESFNGNIENLLN